jgi:SAM-dependent methyltransferase
VYAAGVPAWGHCADDPGLRAVLGDWVAREKLAGKRVIEFACGEGASGVVLSALGAIYTGVDVAPAAVARARGALKGCPDARAYEMDMVKRRADGEYDAALDVMGLHMLVTDADRAAYLKNARAVLRKGAPMLFFRVSFRENAYEGQVDSYEDWVRITGDDYETPEPRFAGDVEVMLPLLPARAMNREGYARELEAAGFAVEAIEPAQSDGHILLSATIRARAV